MYGFPGATAVSALRVYDWPTADGKRGGSPHLHTASSEGYVVTSGTGTLETLSRDGYTEHPLAPGTVLWFTPGTVHRLVTDGDLELLVVMQNAGLPEAGDAVLTFPPEVLADPAAYARAAALAVPTEIEAGPQTDLALADAARRRRDLALEGYLRLREGGSDALAELHRAAAALVRDRAENWAALWRERALAQAERTGAQLRELAEGRPGLMSDAEVAHANPNPPGRHGMCGHLQTWAF
ncbi:cupin domain-containing protein [Catellatospora tritici]|uniref:cupin domain-containing protein n=1 Tax=Catellatospora tritici TaxID=2851566 RepID=UPI0027DF4DDA|nr:cupin domain-containing protein [Catellatospora tritici]